MSKTNLLKETLKVLKSRHKTPADVQWVGSQDGTYAISWDEFAAIADVNYDASYGSAEIVMDLVVVGDSWWLERGEYDGSEWWEFKSKPTWSVEEPPKQFSCVKAYSYEHSIKDLQAEWEKRHQPTKQEINDGPEDAGWHGDGVSDGGHRD